MNKKYFVTFLSPGTFFNETTTKEISGYNISLAKQMAESITERHNARPYAFYFTTKELQGEGWDAKTVIVHTSPTYYIRGTQYSLSMLEARNNPRDNILIGNMRSNKWPYVVEVNGQYFPFSAEDTFI